MRLFSIGAGKVLYWSMLYANNNSSTPVPPPPITNGFLLEDGSGFIVLNSGDYLLQE